MDKVWNGVDGKCMICESNKNLIYYYNLPLRKGDAITYRNLQILCETCNRSRSDKIV